MGRFLNSIQQNLHLTFERRFSILPLPLFGKFLAPITFHERKKADHRKIGFKVVFQIKPVNEQKFGAIFRCDMILTGISMK